MRLVLPRLPQFWLAGRAAFGVLFRRGDGLQLLADVKAIALDKTGTLTVGRPSITPYINPRPCIRACLAAVTAPMIAKAMEAMARDSGATLMGSNFRAERGRGVTGSIMALSGALDRPR